MQISSNLYESHRTLAALPENILKQYNVSLPIPQIFYKSKKKINLNTQNYLDRTFTRKIDSNLKQKITKIEFIDLSVSNTSLPPKNIYSFIDISADMDGSIIAALHHLPNTKQFILEIYAHGKIYAPAYCGRLFWGFSNMQSINFNNQFDTSKVTDMHSMFYDCKNLQTLDLSNFDTSKVINMDSMFYNCENLQTLDLSSFDTSRVTNMNHMFGRCKALKSLDLRSFNTSNVTDINSMFILCISLQTIEVSRLHVPTLEAWESMVECCFSLKNLLEIIERLIIPPEELQKAIDKLII